LRRSCRPPALFSATLFALAALAGLIAGCDDPFKHIEAASVVGRVSADLLPADREVGSWRRAGGEGQARRLSAKAFRQTFGDEAFARAKPWEPGDGASAVYRLGETGRTVTVEVYDLTKAKGAFDVYGLLREAALAGENPAAKVTKAGVQGLLYSWIERKSQTDRRLLFWAERFMMQLTAVNGKPDEAEAALLAFAGAVTAKLEQPFDLPEVYALQIPGEAANSERYQPGRIFGRRELAGGVTAKWTGKSGAGTLFVSASESRTEAATRFERLRRTCKGEPAPNFAEGLFFGELPGAGPVVCFRHGRALAGLVGAVERGEALAAVEEIRRRCAGEPLDSARGSEPAERAAVPAGKPEAGKP
jgi:hypothetical protein